jgi:phytoene/squalene synthetase
VERTSGEPPTDPEWRADALAQSRHTRLEDVLVEPLADFDPERAALVCAEVTRRALRDFAPALVLLPRVERRRAQALAAFSLTLFDFARQSSLEGEKLAQINRWAFDLEASLDGAVPGQPVFVAMAEAHRRQPWSRDALDSLIATARRRALAPRPATLKALERRSEDLAAALSGALWGGDGGASTDLFAALLRLRTLLALGDDRRRHQAGLPEDELPEAWSAEPQGRSALDEAVRRECERLTGPLTDAAAVRRLPPAWRRAASYSLRAGRALHRQLVATAGGTLDAPPTLGAARRIGLLLHSRWLPL